jgi:mono/diheme cytochrome c family protein
MRLPFALCLMLAAAAPAAAQDLPPGPGRDETQKACGGCHGVDVFLDIRRNQGEWETTIQNMINFGMTISDADYDTVLAYLTTYFGAAPRPLIPRSGAPATSP